MEPLKHISLGDVFSPEYLVSSPLLLIVLLGILCAIGIVIALLWALLDNYLKNTIEEEVKHQCNKVKKTLKKKK